MRLYKVYSKKLEAMTVDSSPELASKPAPDAEMPPAGGQAVQGVKVDAAAPAGAKDDPDVEMAPAGDQNPEETIPLSERLEVEARAVITPLLEASKEGQDDFKRPREVSAVERGSSGSIEKRLKSAEETSLLSQCSWAITPDLFKALQSEPE